MFLLKLHQYLTTGRLSDAKLVVKLLCSDNIHEIKVITDNLIANNIDRKLMQDKITNKVLSDIENSYSKDQFILISHSLNIIMELLE